MLSVACVLRSGGDYTPEHVLHLRDGVAKHLTIPHRFTCLTDTPIPGVHCILLAHDWPGWWSKLELWRPGVFPGPVLYFDLDTIITGSLDELAGAAHTFTVLRNFWVYPGHPRIGSGMMAWGCDLSAIYHKFMDAPDAYMAASQTKENWGDQGFIAWAAPFRADRWQVRFPEQVVSYKKHVLPNGDRVPEGARVVCYHGRPRPWHTDHWSAA